MDKQEFEKRYAKGSGVTIEELKGLGFAAVPCDCGEGKCAGWAAMFDRKHEPVDDDTRRIKIVLSDESWERWDAESRRLQKMVGNAR